MYVVPSAYHQFITLQHVKDGLQECLPSVHLLTKQRLKSDLELCERILRHHKVGMAVSVLNGSKVGAGPSLGPQLLLLLESGAD